MTRQIFILVLAYFASNFSTTATPAQLKETVAVSFNETENGDGGYKLDIQSGDKQDNVLLRKRDPKESVLYDGLNVLSADVDDDENLILESWLPSEEELRLAEDIYIDEKLKAAIRIEDSPLGEKLINGIINDYSIVYKDGLGHETIKHQESIPQPPKTNEFNSDNDEVNGANEPGENVVELLIVCDKDFGDSFDHDRKKILDYWTVFMWDINLRFKTLTKTKISFQVVGIVVIKNKKAQPFIEEARLSNGRAEHGKILEKFSAWVYEKRDLLPKFDMAVVVEKTEMEWTGGRAFMKGPCRIDDVNGTQMNTLSFNDDGNWNSVTIAAHQMGHSLGSPHDEEVEGCKERGYIMSKTSEFKWFFSSCSDQAISDFVKTDTAACLKTKENKRIPILSPEFESPLALTMNAQCKLLTGNHKAYVDTDPSNSNCRDLKCLVRSDRDDDNNESVQVFNLTTVDNTICGDGKEEMRCFRGRCRPVGYLLKNVATGLCMRAKNPYYFRDSYEMVTCPRYGTPLDRIVMQWTNVGVTLSSPYHQINQDLTLENNDKCGFAGLGRSSVNIVSDRCGTYASEFIGWELIWDAGNSQFLIMHKKSRRFVRPESQAVGSIVKIYENNNSTNNDEFKWTRTL